MSQNNKSNDMGRDKTKDDKIFNCSEEYELNYVSGLYENKKAVYDFLVIACRIISIKNSTHLQVYKLIKAKFGYEIPLAKKQ